MNKRMVPLVALVMTAVFCALSVGPIFAVRHSSARVDSEKAPLNLNDSALPTDPEAIFDDARIVHNVTVDGKKGMRVHAKFHVKYGKGVECKLIAYFNYDNAASTPLKSADPNYRTKNGNVAESKNFTPGYDPAVYNDLQLFMPYKALNMASGHYNLKFYMALYDKEGHRFFSKSRWYKFQLTVP